MSTKHTLAQVKKLIPPLLPQFHKGQAGRIAVFGGCQDYTGAPFFAASAAALLGVDMSHIVCDQAASTVIKSYSPDLMVHPYLFERSTIPDRYSQTSDDYVVESVVMPKVDPFLDRVHAIVVGPGMGRDPLMLLIAEAVLKAARKREMPIVVDADGLFLITQKPELVKGYVKCILTPNVVEFSRLVKGLGLKQEASVADVAQELGGVTIVQKGASDCISNGSETVKNDMPGGLKRCGGQGDTMAGLLVCFLAWKVAYQNRLWEGATVVAESGKEVAREDDAALNLLAAFGASAVTRTCSREAFKAKGRAMRASDLDAYIQKAFQDLFDKEGAK